MARYVTLLCREIGTKSGNGSLANWFASRVSSAASSVCSSGDQSPTVSESTCR